MRGDERWDEGFIIRLDAIPSRKSEEDKAPMWSTCPQSSNKSLQANNVPQPWQDFNPGLNPGFNVMEQQSTVGREPSTNFEAYTTKTGSCPLPTVFWDFRNKENTNTA